MYEATKHLNTPFFIGIMPIASYNNALFLHNEVPGIKMSEDVLNQFKAVKDDKEKLKNLVLDFQRNSSIRCMNTLMDYTLLHLSKKSIIH